MISVLISVLLLREKQADAEAPVFPMESVAAFAHSECLDQSSEGSCLQGVVIMWDLLLFLCSFLPNYVSHSDKYQQKAFCGVYSEDGSLFLSASQGKYCILFMVWLRVCCSIFKKYNMFTIVVWHHSFTGPLIKFSFWLHLYLKENWSPLGFSFFWDPSFFSFAW